jgi:hypothetical protein
MQQTTPFHRDNYSRLILGVLIQFYQKCSDRFRELVSTKDSVSADEAHVAIAAKWAQKLEVAACVSALYANPVSVFILSSYEYILNYPIYRNMMFLAHDEYADKKPECS